MTLIRLSQKHLWRKEQQRLASNVVWRNIATDYKTSIKLKLLSNRQNNVIALQPTCGL